MRPVARSDGIAPSIRTTGWSPAGLSASRSSAWLIWRRQTKNSPADWSNDLAFLARKERDHLLTLGADLAAVWDAPTTTPRDQKELLRSLIEEVILSVDRDEPAAHLTVRWKAFTDVDVPLPRSRPPTIRTDEETLILVRRLATLYPDTVIAGILNRQGRTTARGHRFEANRVAHLRTHRRIPCFQRNPEIAEGDVMTIAAAASS
jgi:hypothetical protein